MSHLLRIATCHAVATRVSEVFGWSWIPNNTRSRSQTFLSDSGSEIGLFFYITLLSWVFLLQWYDFFWNFLETDDSCCLPQFPLSASCYTIVDSQTFIYFILKCQRFWKGGRRSRKFGKVGVGVGHYTSDSATLVATAGNINTCNLSSQTCRNLWQKRLPFSQSPLIVTSKLVRTMTTCENKARWLLNLLTFLFKFANLVVKLLRVSGHAHAVAPSVSKL